MFYVAFFHYIWCRENRKVSALANLHAAQLEMSEPPDPVGGEGFQDERPPIFASAKAREEQEQRSGPGFGITLGKRDDQLFDVAGAESTRAEEAQLGRDMWHYVSQPPSDPVNEANHASMGRLRVWVMHNCLAAGDSWSATQQLGERLRDDTPESFDERHVIKIEPELRETLRLAGLHLMADGGFDAAHAMEAMDWMMHRVDHCVRNNEPFIVAELDIYLDLIAEERESAERFAATVHDVTGSGLCAKRSALFALVVIFEWFQQVPRGTKKIRDFVDARNDGSGTNVVLGGMENAAHSPIKRPRNS